MRISDWSSDVCSSDLTFTGSTAAGRRIGAICGDRIARCTLELGGKSPALILDDYDIDAAARTIAAVTPLMTGQVCSALTRIIIPRHRHDRFDRKSTRLNSSP